MGLASLCYTTARTNSTPQIPAQYFGALKKAVGLEATLAMGESTMRTTLPLFLIFNVLCAASALAVNPMVVVSIDGLRPDAIKKAKATTLLHLIDTGTSFANARTVRPSITLPAHTSMVTGLDPSQHGITWDYYRADYGPVRRVTALEICTNAGLDTALIVAKDKLIHLNRPNSVRYFQKTDKEGKEIADAFENYVGQHGLPDISFLHLPDPDAKGHFLLWMSSFYLSGVRDADEALQRIIDTADAHRNGKPLTVVVTADHGGFGFNHLADIDENNRIPFIAVGENIAPGVVKNDVVRPYDVAATILQHFNLPIPKDWIGKPAPILATEVNAQAANTQSSDELSHGYAKIGQNRTHLPPMP